MVYTTMYNHMQPIFQVKKLGWWILLTTPNRRTVANFKLLTVPARAALASPGPHLTRVARAETCPELPSNGSDDFWYKVMCGES